MKRDSRLSVALHVLMHLDELPGAVTSETLGAMTAMHPVAFRRTMAGLRDAGIVRSEKGHGGGWALARPLATVTLGDVYAALGLERPFSIGHRDPKPRCALEKAANRAIGSALAKAEELLLEQLAGVTVSDLLCEARPERKAKRK